MLKWLGQIHGETKLVQRVKEKDKSDSLYAEYLTQCLDKIITNKYYQFSVRKVHMCELNYTSNNKKNIE